MLFLFQFQLFPSCCKRGRRSGGRCLNLAVDNHRLLLHILRDVAFEFAEAYITLGFLEFLQEIVGEEAMTLG